MESKHHLSILHSIEMSVQLKFSHKIFFGIRVDYFFQFFDKNYVFHLLIYTTPTYMWLKVRHITSHLKNSLITAVTILVPIKHIFVLVR